MREIAPFGIRMPPELKAELLRQSQLAGRSLNQELLVRLRASLDLQAQSAAHNGYTVSQGGAAGYTIAATETERRVLLEFRKLSPEKQQALLAMLALLK